MIFHELDTSFSGWVSHGNHGIKHVLSSERKILMTAIESPIRQRSETDVSHAFHVILLVIA